MRAMLPLLVSVVVVAHGDAMPIRGDVVDEECRPLVAAQVWLIASASDGPSEVIGKAVSGGDGAFSIAGSDALAPPKKNLTLSLLAYVEGRALGWWPAARWTRPEPP